MFKMVFGIKSYMILKSHKSDFRSENDRKIIKIYYKQPESLYSDTDSRSGTELVNFREHNLDTHKSNSLKNI